MASHALFYITALLALAATARASRILQTNTVTLKEWEQCGGEGGDCVKYGNNNCKDAAFVGYVCPKDFVCEKGVMEDNKTPNKWYWQCVKPTADSESEPTPPEDEEEEPADNVVLKEWEQCGGAGGDCAKYGDDNCKDAAFVGYVCPEDFVCEKGVMEDMKTPNTWYWQCVKPEEPAEDIELKEWEQCGGAGGDCAKYGDDNCKDAVFVGYVCPEDFVCEKGVMEDMKTPNKWYWQCVKAKETTPPADADADDEEEEPEEPAEDIELKEWEQCGGAGGACANYGDDNCKDAPFVGYMCAKDTTCKRQKDNQYYWQCLRA